MCFLVTNNDCEFQHIVRDGAQQIDSQRLCVYRCRKLELEDDNNFDDVEHLVKNYNSVGLEMPPSKDVKL